MKKYLFTILCISLLTLTACGKKVGKSADSSSSEAVSEPTSSEISTTVTEATTTEPVTEISTELPADVVISCADSLEAGERITVEDFISNTNASVLNGSDLVDTSQTGVIMIPVQLLYEGSAYETELQAVVEDTTPPVLLNSGSNAMVETGKEFHLTDVVGVGDNYDKNVTLSYDGVVDTSAAGKYPIHAYASDSSGNTAEWDLTVSVLDVIPTPEDNEPALPFDSFISRYGGENRKLGIDVSKWQGDIDFNAVKNAGCEFVIMRIGYFGDEHDIDKYFKQNFENARAAGLEVGVYIYTTANSEEDVKANAAWINEQLGGQPLDFPVVFDWESFGTFQKYGMSIADLNRYYEIFDAEMKNFGYSTMLYSSKNFLNNFWTVKEDYPVWLAHYTDETDYVGSYKMWQMSCHGTIPGIYAPVDLNILYTDR